MLKPHVRNRRASREINALDAIRRVYSNMRHAAVRDMLAVAERQAAELRTAYDGAWWQGLRDGLRRLATAAVHLGLLLGMMKDHLGWQFGDDPADDAGEEVVAYFSAVAEVDFFKGLCFLHHFEDGGAGDVPDGFHAPDSDAWSTCFCEFCEAFIRDVEAVADVDVSGPWADKGTYYVDEVAVCDFTVVFCEVEFVEYVWGRGDCLVPVPRYLS